MRLPIIDNNRVFPLRTLAILFICSSCSGILDFDSLTKGENQDTETEVECITPEDCDDGVDCTSDLCSINGKCGHNPDNSKCGQFEKCDAQEGCVPTGRECVFDTECSDSVDCTDDYCSADGRCLSVPNDNRCYDELDKCIVDRFCDRTLGCQGGRERICDQPSQGLPCSQVTCNPETGVCDLNVPVAGADNDDDGYLDTLCGGDDCNDDDPAIHPSSAEVCNLIDDDCDGITDAMIVAGPATVIEGSKIDSPALVSSGTRYALAWQRTPANRSAVYLKVLGSEGCLLDTACNDSSDQIPALETVNITPYGGATSTARQPAMASYQDRFVIVWVSEQTTSASIMALEFEIDTERNALVFDSSASTIFEAEIDSISPPVLSWTAADWVLAFRSQDTGSQYSLRIVDRSMSARKEAPTTILTTEEAPMELSLTCLDQENCLLVYSQKTTLSGGSEEIHAVRLDRMGDAWSCRSGWPQIVSNTNPADMDPSTTPFPLWLDDSQWMIAFTDVAIQPNTSIPEGETDIRASIGGDIRNLIWDDLYNQQAAGIARRDGEIGILYLQEMSNQKSINFRLFDQNLLSLDKMEKNITAVADATVKVAGLIRNKDAFATAWVETKANGDGKLIFLSFDVCSSSK